MASVLAKFDRVGLILFIPSVRMKAPLCNKNGKETGHSLGREVCIRSCPAEYTLKISKDL